MFCEGFYLGQDKHRQHNGRRSTLAPGMLRHTQRNHTRVKSFSSVSILDNTSSFDTPMLKVAFWNNKCEFTLTHLTWISVQGLLLLNNIYLFWEGRHNISSLQLAVMSMNSLFTSECKRNSWINPNFYVDCLRVRCCSCDPHFLPVYYSNSGI